jgi:hypothetical protein
MNTHPVASGATDLLKKRKVGKSDAALTAISRFTRNGLPHLRKCGEAPSFVLWLE